jgi:hypothetical protein
MSVEPSDASDIDPVATIKLARRLAEANLCPEALDAWRKAGAAIRRDDIPAAARCNFQLGRYEAVLDLTKDVGAGAEAHRPMALAALGAYREAAIEFGKLEGVVQGEEFWVLAAETALATGDEARAARAIAALEAGATPEQAAATTFLKARLAHVHGDRGEARRLFNAAARLQTPPWSERARLHQIQCDEDDGEALRSAALSWHGGAFEREALLAIGFCDVRRGDIASALRPYRLLATRHQQSDVATVAVNKGAALLPMLLAANSPLPPETAARAFFANVDLAPPGHDGDLLIKDAARRLAELDLHEEAATLLEHQVFKRLRGVERSLVAIELAERYLDAGAAAEAVRVMQSTRIAGLPAEILARRRELEATALARIGRTDAAISLLEAAGQPRHQRRLAEIYWAERRWSEAARSYAAAFEAGGERRDLAAQLALRAAAAHLLAGDRDGYRAFAAIAAARLEDHPVADLIASMGEARPGVDFDRRFLKDYRAAFDVKAEI